MILSFSKPSFVHKINEGIKIHTIRKDKHNRWKEGMTIHFWKSSPRNVKASPYQFKVGTCVNIELIRIERVYYGIHLWIKPPEDHIIDWVEMEWPDIKELAYRDGLTEEEFVNWFDPNMGDTFEGKIIHWTNQLYYTAP